MRRLGLLLSLLAPLACRPDPPISDDSRTSGTVPRSAADLYRDAYASLDHGRFEEASERALAAEHAQSAGAAGAPSIWAMRVLRAEILGRQRRNQDVLALLDAASIPGEESAEVQVRASITVGLARCRVALAEREAREGDAQLATAQRLADHFGDQRLIASAAVSRSACAAEQRWFPEAERLAQSALAAARRADAPMEELSAAGMLSYVRLNGERFDDAAAWARRARLLAIKLGNDLLLVKANGNLARSYALSGQVERALPLLEQNVRLARASPDYEAALLIELINAGDAYMAVGDDTRAVPALREAATLAQRHNDLPNIARALKSLGLLALSKGDHEVAWADTSRALDLKLRVGDEDGANHARICLARVAAARGQPERACAILRQVVAAGTAAPRYHWEARARLAALYAGMHRVADAEGEFARAFAQMEEGRTALSEPSSRIAFVATLQEFYDSYVDFLVTRKREREALEAADHSRARLLLERLGRGDQRLRSVRVAEFQRVAKRLDATLLSYWLAPRQSYLWAVTSDAVELHVLPGQDKLCPQVDAYQAVVQRSRDPVAEQRPEGRALFDALVVPAQSHLPRGARALLVLDGCLHQLNFETLPAPGSPARYWIDDVTLSVAPSLGALDAVAGPRVPARARSLLVIGAPLSASQEFPPLAQAEREVRELKDLFPPERVEAHTGAGADPSVYTRARPGRFGLIHFAAHATASRDSPLDSAVVLSPKGDDYKLYARDVLNAPLTADVVTLSACHSAGARAYAGEGLVGLAWAFLSAGSRNVVAGLWNVEDASTAELMEALYRGLRDGHDPADALRGAKLALLHSGTAYSKPFYWAPFQVYTRAPSAPARSSAAPHH